jgi:DNA-binding transcriptional LysR family regulator
MLGGIMDFRNLEYIVSIAKYQSIGKAAEECFVSQPTISKFVQHLENSLGQPLFQRAGKKFFLTYAGERYVTIAKTILEAKRGLDKELTDILQEDTGELKIAFRVCGGINIPRLLSRFWNHFPRIKIKIHEDNSKILENEILKGDIDLAFLTLPINHPEIAYEIIRQEKLLLLMAPNHPKADRGVFREGWTYPWMDVAKLKDEPFILQWPGHKTRQITDKIFQEAGFKPNILLTIRDLNIAVQMALEGFGITFAGESFLRHISPNKKPLCFSIGTPAAEFNFAVAFRAGIYQPNYVKQFIRIAKESFESSPVFH